MSKYRAKELGSDATDCRTGPFWCACSILNRRQQLAEPVWGRSLRAADMRHYHFVLDDGSGPDGLGDMVLRDDDAARVFGKQVIRDLRQSDRCASGVMLIAEGERTVGVIPFPRRDQTSANGENDVSSAKEYRIRATDCHDQAARSINEVDKESWLRIADGWMILAESCERRAPDDAAVGMLLDRA
jgi:hypothetical protein